MTKQELRDHFAGQALQGLVASGKSSDHWINKKGDEDFTSLEQVAYAFADGMLAERENHKHEWGNIIFKNTGRTCTLCGKVELLEE